MAIPEARPDVMSEALNRAYRELSAGGQADIDPKFLKERADQIARTIVDAGKDEKWNLAQAADGADGEKNITATQSTPLAIIEDHLYVAEIGGLTLDLARDVQARQALTSAYQSAQQLFGNTNMMHFAVSAAAAVARGPRDIGRAMEKTIKADIQGNKELGNQLAAKVNKDHPDIEGGATELWYKGDKTARAFHDKLERDPRWRAKMEQKIAEAKRRNPSDGWSADPAAIELKEFQKLVRKGHHESPAIKKKLEALNKMAPGRPLHDYSRMKIDRPHHPAPAHKHPMQKSLVSTSIPGLEHSLRHGPTPPSTQ